MAEDPLLTYRARRDFGRTAEPAGAAVPASGGGRRYLIQKHAATRLHYDLRLEHDGVLKSWAVTRGPSLDPADKRLAVHVEDHPLEYGDFEGTIPKGEYGGGTVMLWDEGSWEPIEDADAGLAGGKLKFRINGSRLHGLWILLRLKGDRGRPRGDRPADNWLLFKERDAFAEPNGEPITGRATTSVRSGRTMEEIAAGHVEWTRTGPRIKEGVAPPPETGRRAPAGKAAPAKTFPAFVPPQMATLVDAPPSGPGWLHEIKYDGYRALAAISGGEVRIYTRTGLDWTDRFGALRAPLADLPINSALIDGEVTVLDTAGKTSFGALQHALAEGRGTLVFHAFDVLELDGQDLKKKPLAERKDLLAALLKGSPPGGPLLFSDHVAGDGARVFDEACRLGLEGIVSKRADAPYRSERGSAWLKTKCGHGQEFVVVGWEPSPVKGRPFASLLMAAREDDRLVYRGRVGSGYSGTSLDAVWQELAARPATEPAAEGIPPAIRKSSRFVRPELVADVAFRGWSSDGLIRQGSFKGLRRDKAAAAVTLDAAAPPPADLPPAAGARARRGTTKVDKDDVGTVEIEGVRVTHPEKVMFPGRNITKRMVIDYYLLVADRILAHIADRPLSLVRCPQGQGGDCFFQKHASPGFPGAFKPISITDSSGTDIYLYVEDRAGLVSAVQMGALELHIWGSHVATLEQPDRLVFDFDPDEAVTFAQVKTAAAEMRERLGALGLASFAMATGGKGLHVVVPLTLRHGWEDIRAFAEAMARTMAADAPALYLAEMSKAKRRGRIFIDYLRNGRGATAIAPFSTRARGGAPVAWPVAWAALAKLEDAHPVAVDGVAIEVRRKRADPWPGYGDVDQVLPIDRLTGA